MKHTVIETILKNSPHLGWIDGRTVLLVRHGSHAYGTNTPESDEDFKGIAIPPKKYFFGAINKFEQAELHGPDAVIYDIRKFFTLASDCNPNIIEVLHTDASDHCIVDPIGEIILEHKNDFLSKKIKHTFMGYSISQLKRIKTHKKWIMTPPKSPPTRAEFGLPEQTMIPQDQLMAVAAEVQKELDRFQFSFLEDLEESTKIAIQSTMISMLAELKITADQHWEAAARKVGLNDNFIQVMQKEREYLSKKREWDQYQNWKKNRNPARASLEEKFGYDCYLDDTEFLTSNGWKLYSEINDCELLATLNQKSGEIEYQFPYERVCKEYSGPIVFLRSENTECAVTPNHRMWISKIDIQKSNNFSAEYEENNSNWEIKPAESLINNRDSWFYVRVTASPKSNDFDITDNYLKLLGAYISKDGSLHKHLPHWWINLSQRQALILLDALLFGDGIYKKESVVYYTASKQLAGQIQAMCISNGIVSEVCGPYKNRDNSPIYHVYIGNKKTVSVTNFNSTSSHIKIENVRGRKIVCFSVPNEILITRRNGRVSIQGNTKHAYHLVRLIRMCREILTTGKVIVKRPDKEELLAIRKGAWTYEQLIEFAESEDIALNKLYATSTVLPKQPNKQMLDNLCIDLVEKSLSKYSWYNVNKYLKKVIDKL